MGGMADDRSVPGSTSAGADLHDDDELADVLAAELERYATGAVPVLGDAAIRPPAGPSIDAPPGATAARSAGGPSTPDRGSTASDGDPRPGFDQDDAAPTFRRPTTLRAPGRHRPADVGAAGTSTEEQPVRRRSGYRAPAGGASTRTDPMDRVLPTGPIGLPETTASLLDEMIAESAPAQTARHTEPVASTEESQPERHRSPAPAPAPLPGAASDPLVHPMAEPLRRTGPLEVPQPLYADWEQSLRSIGRPRAAWEDDEDPVPQRFADIDAPTVAVGVQPPPGTTGARAAREPEPATEPEPEPEPEDRAPAAAAAAAAAASVNVGRRSARRRAPVAPVRLPADEVVADAGRAAPQEDPALAPATDDAAADVDEEGIDEVAVDYPGVSAATTGAIDLPSVEPRPHTAPVLIERLRTAILQLPDVPASPTGSGAAAIIGRWLGAFASPLALLLGIGLAAAGAGPSAAVAVLAGVLLVLPAAARSGAWAASSLDDGAMQETAVLGPAPGRTAAAVLVLARVAAAVAALFGAASLVSAWVGRTGAFGGGSATAGIATAAGIAVLATCCAALPVRVAAALTLLLGAVGVVGTVLVALLLAPTGDAAGSGTAAGAVAAATAGFLVAGLLVVLCGPDVARWRTDLAHPASGAVAAVVSAVLAAAVLAGATSIGALLGAAGDPADAFAGSLSDATASALAAPLAVVLLLASITLPAMLLRSAGTSAARVVGRGAPVRLGTVAAGLLALAGALGLLALGADSAVALVSVAAAAGVPVAAWAGLLTATSGRLRGGRAALLLVVACLAGWVLADGLVPGAGSVVLDAVGLTGPLRGGPAVGLLVAFAVGAAAGGVSRTRGGAGLPAADTVEG